MEKEPKIEKSSEEKLRERGYRIEPVDKEDLAQCDKDDCFEEAGWFIEGSFCCPEHKGSAIKALEEVEKNVQKRKLEQERIIEERKKIADQAREEWAKKGENLELREKLEQKRKELEEKRRNEGV